METVRLKAIIDGGLIGSDKIVETQVGIMHSIDKIDRSFKQIIGLLSGPQENNTHVSPK